MPGIRSLLKTLNSTRKAPRKALMRRLKRLDARFLLRIGVPRSVKRLHGPPPPKLGRDEVLAICVLRDGEYWLDEFLAHHRRLGVRHFVFLDNGSRDRTLPRLAAEADVTVYSLPLAFQRAARPAYAWALQTFAADRWALMLDIDELFDYPGSTQLPLTALTRMLRDTGASALPALMLDMYSAEPLRSDDARPFDRARFDRYDILDVKPMTYPDGFDIAQPASGRLDAFIGGVRYRALGAEPVLTKHPLVLGDGRCDVTITPHFTAHVRLSDTTAVLFHYKLVPGFAAQVRRAVAEGNYFDGSREYRKYMEHTERADALDLTSSSTRRLQRTDQLVDEGVMRVGAAWRALLERSAEVRTEEARV